MFPVYILCFLFTFGHRPRAGRLWSEAQLRPSVRKELNRDCLVCTTCLLFQLWEDSHMGTFPPLWRADYDDVRARVCLCVHWEMVLTQTGPAPCTCQCNKSQQPQQCRRRERKIKSPGGADVNFGLSSSLHTTKCWCSYCGMWRMAALPGRVGRCVWSGCWYGRLRARVWVFDLLIKHPNNFNVTICDFYALTIKCDFKKCSIKVKSVTLKLKRGDKVIQIIWPGKDFLFSNV